VSDQKIHDICHAATDAYSKFGKGAEYSRLKKRLPLLMFCCTFDENRGAKGNRPPGAWRNQQAVRLNGLFIYDADCLKEQHGMTPRELYDKIPQWLFDGKETRHVMFAGMTPSGDGLRIVCTCDSEKGNLADHQQWLGTILGVPCDKSVKDASRGSFITSSDYIYFIDPEIFDYDNEAYRKAYNDCYRSGHTAASDSPALPAAGSGVPSAGMGVPENKEAVEKIDGCGVDGGTVDERQLALDSDYHGVKYQKIVNVYCSRHPDYTKGDRHQHLLRMAGRLRYIVDNSPAKLKQLVRLAQYVQEWEAAEKNGGEIDNACTTACQQRYYASKPKAIQDVLMRAGVKAADAMDEKERQCQLVLAQRVFRDRFMEILPEPYKTVMTGLDPLNVVPAVYAAGTMMCTLMTRCHYVHYTGDEQRMNPQALIIGEPASGKSFVDVLDKILMQPVKNEDELSRQAEKKYKDSRRERETSSKAQRGDALKRPEMPIRYLTTNTSNNVFFRRLSNAKEEMEAGEVMHLHLYMFDSELASANKRNGGADWIGKRDLELKAFHNETTGVDYANNDSINELMQVFWNTVTTGTKIALAQKFTMQNINDGLCTRVAIAPMVSDHFKMLQRGDQLQLGDRRARLMSWAFEMSRLSGLLNVEKLVDHTFQMCQQAAEAAAERNDLVLDTLRRRAVFYAQWFTIPAIVVRAIEERRKLAAANKDGKELPSVMDLVTVTDDDLRLAEVLFDSVIYWQDAFFGQMLSDSWENGEKNFTPRIRSTRNSETYATLPQEFTIDDVEQRLALGRSASASQVRRWLAAGFIERMKQGKYKKVYDSII